MSKTLQKFFVLLTILCTTAGIAQTLIMDDLEAYDLGDLSPQSEHWTTWSGAEGGAEDGIVTDEQANSGTKSMLIDAGPGPQDVLLLLGNQTEGTFHLSWYMYVDAGRTAYWNIQDQETPGVAWNMDVFLGVDNTGALSPGNGYVGQLQMPIADITYPEATWFLVEQIIDLDNDELTLNIDGALATTIPFSAATNGQGNLGAVDFYPIDANNRYFVDDITFSQPITVTVTVDMSNEESISEEGVHIAGSFQDWDPSTTAMTDNGDGTWSYIINGETGQEIQYKFINGIEWADEESVPEDCGIDNGVGGFNRVYTIGEESTTLETICFSECTDCATALITDVIFTVDMTNEAVESDGMFIAGEFQDPQWSPNATPMTDNGDNTYSVSLTVMKGQTYEYKFVNGGTWGGAEHLEGTECGVGDNRVITIGDETMLGAVCFSSCDTCEVIDTDLSLIELSNLNIAPNPTNDFTVLTLDFEQLNSLQVQIYNSVGQLVVDQNNQAAVNGQLSLNVTDLPSDLYFVQVSNGKETASSRLVVIK